MSMSQSSLLEETCNASITGMIQRSIAALNAECENLEREIENKNREFDEATDNVSRQAKNIAEVGAEIERIKVLTHKEVMEREAFLVKNSALISKVQTLEKYFSRWFPNINLLMHSKEQLLELVKQQETELADAEGLYKQLENEQNKALEKAEEFVKKLEHQKDQEEKEFAEVETHLKAEIKKHDHMGVELEEKIRNIKNSCSEKFTILNMLKPQNDALKQKLAKLKHDMAFEKKEKESIIDNLQAQLREELKKKQELTGMTEEMDQTIYKLNYLIINEDEEIKRLDSQQKELITTEDDYSKILETEMEKLTKLQSEAEAMKQQLREFMEIDEENRDLTKEVEKLEDIEKSLKCKISEVDETETCYRAQIQEQNMHIAELQDEINKVISERAAIEESINILQQEIIDNEKAHQLKCSELDKTYVELTEQDEVLSKTISSLSAQLREHSEDKECLDETVRALKVELEKAKVMSEESDRKVLEKQSELDMTKEKINQDLFSMDEKIAKAKENYSKAQSDEVLLEKTKVEIEKLELELKNLCENHKSSLAELSETYNAEFETKNQQVEEFRLKLEREYRNKESCKTNALVELKENAARIKEITNQKIFFQNEKEKKQRNIVKCDNLVRKLENKLKVVAHVATHDQSPFISSTPIPQGDVHPPKANTRQVQSPGSESSGMTFNPDDIDLRKVQQRKKLSQKTWNKPPPPTKEKKDKGKKDDGEDLWGRFF